MTTITQADRDGSARDRFAEKCLDVFNAGIVRRPDDKNPRGYTDYYSPYEAMMAVIALVSEAAEARARLEGAKAMQWPDQWPLGTRVRKRKGSSWQGRVVGYYSTDLTPRGYAVESEREPGSVQIYPKAAFEVIDPAQIVGAKP